MALVTPNILAGIPLFSTMSDEERKALLALMTNAPLLDYTTDGGKTWTEASLPTANGIDTASYETTPPICFEGQKKVVPVHIHLNGGSSALAMYLMGTNPGWTINVTKQFDTQNVYVVTTDHFWALDKGTLYGTIDGAQHWTKLANLPTTAEEMSFISILDGWIADSNSPVLYHTGDGGHTWDKIAYSIQS